MTTDHKDQIERGPVNRAQIDVNNGFELRYWAKDMNVSLEQIRSAVRKVGAESIDVRDELKRRGF